MQSSWRGYSFTWVRRLPFQGRKECRSFFRNLRPSPWRCAGRSGSAGWDFHVEQDADALTNNRAQVMAAAKNLGSKMASSGSEAGDNTNDDTAASLDEGDFVKLFSAISVPYIQVRPSGFTFLCLFKFHV